MRNRSGILLKALFKIMVLFFLLHSCSKEEALPVHAEFEFEVFNNDFTVPVEVILFNATTGADDYLWTFEGASPQTSSQRNPGVITYAKKGSYTILLKATNTDGSEDTFSKTLIIEDPIEMSFTAHPKEDFFSPSTLILTNATKGADTYKWTFEGGEPSVSTNQTPPEVIFTEVGTHKITLEAGNAFENKTLTKEIEILPLLEADFDFEVHFEDDDLQIPVQVEITQKSTSATSYSWQFSGATSLASSEENPTVIVNQAGVQTLTLTASNGKQTKTISKQIEVFEDTNLRILKNIKLGINTAHNNNVIGAAYSLDSRKTYTKDAITLDNGETIDFMFFGLNNSFTRNAFVSADNLEATTFSDIPNANSTKIINRLEDCNCGVELSSEQFEAMENDELLHTFTITQTTAGSLPFDNSSTPRIVLFQTADGRKGALKINRFVENSTNSFIEIAIKVQKVAR